MVFSKGGYDDGLALSYYKRVLIDEGRCLRRDGGDKNGRTAEELHTVNQELHQIEVAGVNCGRALNFCLLQPAARSVVLLLLLLHPCSNADG